MRSKHSDIPKRHIPQASRRASVMENFPHLLPAPPHPLKPPPRNLPQLIVTLRHPSLNRRVPLNRPIKPQQVLSHPHSATRSDLRIDRSGDSPAILERNRCLPHPSISAPLPSPPTAGRAPSTPKI